MKKLIVIAILLAAMIAFEYFVVNVGAYALNEMTRYQIKDLVMLVSIAFVAMDVGALYIFTQKYPDFGAGYLLVGWFLAFTIRAGLVWQGLAIAFAVTHPEWLTIAPVALALAVWLLNIVLVYFAGRVFQMSMR